jgi:hypothetical protein
LLQLPEGEAGREDEDGKEGGGEWWWPLRRE